MSNSFNIIIIIIKHGSYKNKKAELSQDDAPMVYVKCRMTVMQTLSEADIEQRLSVYYCL